MLLLLFYLAYPIQAQSNGHKYFCKNPNAWQKNKGLLKASGTIISTCDEAIERYLEIYNASVWSNGYNCKIQQDHTKLIGNRYNIKIKAVASRCCEDHKDVCFIERSAKEKMIWVFVTAVTNIIFIPRIFHRDVLLKRHLVFETVLTAFTILSSFIYHFCDSMAFLDVGPKLSTLTNGMFLGEGLWHILDNITSILCIIVLLIHFTNYQNEVYAQLNKFVALWVVLLCQFKSPWDLKFTVVPIVIQIVILILKYIFVDGLTIPAMNRFMLKRSVLFQSIGFMFFYLGLDKDKDPYRLYHGLWHTFTGIATYYHWQVIESHREDRTKTKKEVGLSRSHFV